MVDSKSIYQVLQMYSKKDFMDFFMKVSVEALSQKQIVELFVTCIKFDSFKMGM